MKKNTNIAKETKIILLKILKRGFITEEEKSHLMKVFEVPLFKIVLPDGVTDLDSHVNSMFNKPL